MKRIKIQLIGERAFFHVTDGRLTLINSGVWAKYDARETL